MQRVIAARNYPAPPILNQIHRFSGTYNIQNVFVAEELSAPSSAASSSDSQDTLPARDPATGWGGGWFSRQLDAAEKLIQAGKPVEARNELQRIQGLIQEAKRIGEDQFAGKHGIDALDDLVTDLPLAEDRAEQLLRKALVDSLVGLREAPQPADAAQADSGLRQRAFATILVVRGAEAKMAAYRPVPFKTKFAALAQFWQETMLRDEKHAAIMEMGKLAEYPPDHECLALVSRFAAENRAELTLDQYEHLRNRMHKGSRGLGPPGVLRTAVNGVSSLVVNHPEPATPASSPDVTPPAAGGLDRAMLHKKVVNDLEAGNLTGLAKYAREWPGQIGVIEDAIREIDPSALAVFREELAKIQAPLLAQEVLTTGGIDFRALPIVTQPLISHQSPVISLQSIPRADLDEEFRQIEMMIAGGIIPSLQRIKEYLGAACASKDCQERVNKVLTVIADIFRLEEERVLTTASATRDLLVLLESDKPAKELQAALGGIVVEAKEPQLIEP
jgi:hypothetical protein